ncbi:FIST C-terminal domain-containing protein [Ruminococcaceae bacterium OttesenSCG-928-O06]|nr:FIST C-terminal domain-containing protein [Ruminococcaceae bacterium OttesenSCG-928-O06]
MIRMLNACTLEVDEAEVALAELLQQLDWENNRLPNAAAFLTCSCDFLETDVLRHVCDALPFPVVGCTTLANAAPREAGTMMLCLTVLCSDDCQFATALTPPLGEELAGPIEAAYHKAAATLPAPPALVLAFMPMIRKVGGELILDALDAVAGGAPIFGTIACDRDTSEYENTFTIYEGEGSRDAMSLLLISGNIAPRFFVTSASEDKVQKQKAIITASQGSVLQQVNNISTKEYLRTLGLVQGDGIEGMSAIPFVVNYNDGTQPVARAIYMLTEEGYAVCGGAMPVNATLSIGSIDYEDVLLTARQTCGEILATGKTNGLILFPCLGRNMVLGADYMAEIDAVRESLGGALPFHLAYSGGEVCPVYNEEGAALNRFHNFTFIACVF